MPRFKINGFGEEVVEAKGGQFTPYDGELPPKGVVFNGVVRRLQLVINSKQNPMLKLVVEIREPKGSPNEQYNGAATWHNLNCTEQGSGYVNDFLNALSGNNIEVLKKFWFAGPNLADPKPPSMVKAIGPLAIKDEGMPIRFSSIHKPNQKDPKKMELAIGAFLPAKIKDEVPDDAIEDEVDDGIVDEDDMDDPAEVESEQPNDDDDDDNTSDSAYTDEPPF